MRISHCKCSSSSLSENSVYEVTSILQSVCVSSLTTTPHSCFSFPYIISVNQLLIIAAYLPLVPSTIGMLKSFSLKLMTETGIMKNYQMSVKSPPLSKNQLTAVPETNASTTLPSSHASTTSPIPISPSPALTHSIS
jgi:hypothetical protein